MANKLVGFVEGAAFALVAVMCIGIGAIWQEERDKKLYNREK